MAKNSVLAGRTIGPSDTDAELTLLKQDLLTTENELSREKDRVRDITRERDDLSAKLDEQVAKTTKSEQALEQARSQCQAAQNALAKAEGRLEVANKPSPKKIITSVSNRNSEGRASEFTTVIE